MDHIILSARGLILSLMFFYKVYTDTINNPQKFMIH